MTRPRLRLLAGAHRPAAPAIALDSHSRRDALPRAPSRPAGRHSALEAIRRALSRPREARPSTAAMSAPGVPCRCRRRRRRGASSRGAQRHRSGLHGWRRNPPARPTRPHARKRAPRRAHRSPCAEQTPWKMPAVARPIGIESCRYLAALLVRGERVRVPDGWDGLSVSDNLPNTRLESERRNAKVEHDITPNLVSRVAWFLSV